MVPWAEVGSRFTRDFADQVAYLAQVTDKATVSTTMRIAWKIVGHIIGRVVAHALKDFEATWARRFPMIAASWKSRWAEITPFLAFPRTSDTRSTRLTPSRR
jgi:hypothetical protein